MDDQTEITIAMLKGIIESLESGSVDCLSRKGESIGDTVKYTIVLQNKPVPPEIDPAFVQFG